MDGEHTKRFFAEQFTDRANKLCVDCNAANPQWASATLGSYFCLDCSGTHRGLGVHLSFVRSIDMDTWKEKQLKSMELGGNSRLKALLDKYGLAKMSIPEKYNSQAAQYYREHLKALVEGTPDPCEPRLEDGPKRYTPGQRPASTNAAPTADARSQLFEGAQDRKSRRNAAADKTQEENDQAELRTMLQGRDKMNETVSRMSEASNRLGSQSEGIVELNKLNTEYTSKLKTAADVLGDLKKRTEEDSRYIWWSFCFFCLVVTHILLKRLKVYKLGFAALNWTWWSGAKTVDVLQYFTEQFTEAVTRLRALFFGDLGVNG